MPFLEFIYQHKQPVALHDGLAGNHAPLPQPVVGDTILFRTVNEEYATNVRVRTCG